MAKTNRIRTVAVRVTANIDDFDKKLKSAAKKMDQLGASLSKAGKNLTKGLTLPILAVGGAIAALTTKTAEYADEIDDMATRTGQSIKTLQELRYATGQVGVAFEAIQSTTAAFTNQLKSALGGSNDAAKAFKVLGINLKDNAGRMRPVSDLYMESIKKLANLEDETMRNVMASALFGRGFSELVPLLDQGEAGIDALMKKAQELGLVMGDQSIKKFADFNDKLAEIKQRFQQAGMTLAEKFLPIAEKLAGFAETKLIPMMDKLIGEVEKLIDKFMELPAETQMNIVKFGALAVAIGPALTGLGGITSAVSGLIGLLPKLAPLLGTTAVGLGAFGLIGGVAAVTLPQMYQDRIADLEKQKAVNAAIAAAPNTLTGVKLVTADEIQKSWGVGKTVKDDYNEALAEKLSQKALSSMDAYNISASEQVDLFNKLFGQTEKATSSTEDFTSAIKSTVNAIKEQTKAFANFVGLFDIFERTNISGQRLINRLKAQVNAMMEWRQAMLSLEKRGVNAEFLNELRAMGPAAVDQIKAIAGMTGEQLQQYVGLWGQRYGIAGGEAEKSVMFDSAAQTRIDKQVNITITGNKISNDDDVRRITNNIVKELRLAGVKI